MDYMFRLDMKVRDYECDMQGVVNNSVYQNYLEHARHEYLLDVGIDFAEYAREGINLVVVRAELDYKLSLTSGDKFWIGVDYQQTSPVRFEFTQDIYRCSDEKLILKGKIMGVGLNERGRPVALSKLKEKFENNA